MIVRQTGVFQRKVKKLHSAEKKSLDKAVKKIMGDPSIGTSKKGDLGNIQVYKFKQNTTQYLLAYQYLTNELELTFIAIGTHENFYRDLKQ